MRWNLKYAIRSCIRGLMWLVPPFAVLLHGEAPAGGAAVELYGVLEW